MNPRLKPRPCKQCGTVYAPSRPLQSVCTLTCALDQSRAKGAQAAIKAARQRVIDLKPKSHWAKLAQKSFNAYIVERDRDKVCISCGIDRGRWHASHFRSVAAAKQLRFNTLNVNKSCAQCNLIKSGNITAYRIGLVDKIGEERVLAIEHDNRRANYSDEYLKRIKTLFAKRKKHLIKLRERQWRN